MDYEDIRIELLTDVAESAAILDLARRQIPIRCYGKAVEKSAGVYAYFFFVQKQIREIKPDLFWEGNNLIPIALRNPYGKLAVTVHDVFPITDPDGYGRIYPWYFRWNLRKTLHYVDGVIYNSGDTREQVEHYYPAAKKLAAHISYIITEQMPKIAVTDEGYFLYVGNMEKRKGTDLLLKAYVMYRAQGGQNKLYLAGKMRSGEIEQLLEECKRTTDGICYLGYLESDEKYQQYAACSAFVFPSRAEGFGMPVMEALYYGKKVLVTDLKIFHEIAGDAVMYSRVSADEEETVKNLSDAMLRLEKTGINDQETIAANAGREVLARYQAGTLAGQLRQFFLNLTEGEA
jgi:glycosyltransferase involved in cell wall biosynthesis